MARERGEEAWAIRCISESLGVEVTVHDDGSTQGMHDLNILYPDRPPGAVEVTAAADQVMIETWILATRGGRWIVEGIAGGWAVSSEKDANVKRLRAELPDFLRELEAQGVRAVDPETWWERGPHDERAKALGIRHLFQGGTSFPGSVYLLPQPEAERTGGAVPTDGAPLLGAGRVLVRGFRSRARIPARGFPCPWPRCGSRSQASPPRTCRSHRPRPSDPRT